MFNFIKNKLQKVYQQFTTQINHLFGRTIIDEATLQELEKLLISSDTGIQTTRTIITKLKDKAIQGALKEGETLQTVLQQILLDIFKTIPSPSLTKKSIFVLVGINGSGKTTFAGKLAHHYMQKGQKTLLVAADTFRAAAPEQLTHWAKKSGTTIVLGKQNQDPASVVFTGCQKFKDENHDILIVDTAGRLQTKINLMHELAKIKRIIARQLPEEQPMTLLTIDAMLGQNSFEQAKLFKQYTDVDGIVLTKMDGTGKGGIIFAIAQDLALPIVYLTFGEQANQFKTFDAKDYVTELLSN
jgi:fused signal recognition particle receptor